jgi:KDO2-lipid IV(A) lauroyltransferase
MRVKDYIKIINRTLARHGMTGTYWLINRLPYPVVKWVMHGIIFFGYRLMIKHRRIAGQSLRIAFGQEKTQAEIKKIIHDCFWNLGHSAIEIFYYAGHPHMIKDRVSIEGREHLEAALAQGKGVVAVTAHFGNFPLMLTKFAQEGYPIHILMRRMRDPKIDAFFYAKRTQLGLKSIYNNPRGLCVQNCLKALRNNEILFMLIDQHFGSHGGVLVDFFGRKAATATGPIVLASRTQSPILPIFILRESDDTHRVIIEPAFEIEERKDYDEMLEVNIARMTKLIEGYIRKYPHEWGWMHRRWKKEQSAEGKEEELDIVLGREDGTKKEE